MKPGYESPVTSDKVEKYGALAKSITVANTKTLAYAVPESCPYSNVTISILNFDEANLGSVKIWIGTVDEVGDIDLIESKIDISVGAVYTRGVMTLGPGERIYVQGTTAKLAVRIEGYEARKS